MHVQVYLQDKAKEVVLDEQAKYAKKGKRMGKERLINLLLAELYERRIYDSIATPMTNKQWRKFLKTK
jgi:hypothetical protein